MASDFDKGKGISIVVPFYNEEENIDFVLSEITGLHPHAEVIAVDDGSTDKTADKIRDHSGVKLLKFPQNLGQSAALYKGLLESTRDICVMMDGDGQNDPADIPQLIAALGDHDVACGYRKNRQDSWKKKVASKVANQIRSTVLGDGIRDTGCTLKAMQRRHVAHLIPFNGLHRFIPALLRNAGLTIAEVPVNHRPRQRGTSKYTVTGRALRGVRDLIGVQWFLSRQILWKV